MIACPRCRMQQTAPHRTPDDCIAELRAELMRHETANEREGRRQYSTVIVVLDGVEMTLPKAAKILGVANYTLYMRIYRKGRNYIKPDIRAIGADVALNRLPFRERKAFKC